MCDPNNITTCQYTDFGEQKQIQSPDTGTATSAFNAGGLMVSTTV